MSKQFAHFQYSCFTQSTSITHSPLMGESVILAKFRIGKKARLETWIESG